MPRRNAPPREDACPAEQSGGCGDAACRDGCYYGSGYLQDVVEHALLAHGGPELLADAHAHATEFVDRAYPWDGAGPEPAGRVDAYIAVLWRFAKNARADRLEGPA